MDAPTGAVAVAAPGETATTVLIVPVPGALARIAWFGTRDAVADGSVAGLVGRAGAPGAHEATGRSVPLLPELAHGWRGRPGLSGHRLGRAAAVPPAGRDWSTAFRTHSVTVGERGARIESLDEDAGLALRSDVEALPGGCVRLRHTLTNLAEDPYLVEALDVVLPLPDRVSTALDWTGRWALERVPQRHQITDGLWLREGRIGKPGADSPTMLCAGVPGFGFATGEVWSVHVAWSGNYRYLLERQPSGLTVLGGGELLLPGELVLAAGQSYSTPWLHAAAAVDGLDGLAALWHADQRARPARSAEASPARPVTFNTWEATYFDQRPERLLHLADLAARVGVERFVLDDGWFGARRDERAGLGDWKVSPQVWPQGLGPLIGRVRALGMQMGIWIEPEMVNPDSDLFRAHPDWVLAVPAHEPRLIRGQLVLDLGREQVRAYLAEAIGTLLAEHDIGFVKWDHNRELVDAGIPAGGGVPGVHQATLGFYALLDELRARFPGVQWESCAAGGGRIDLEVLSRVDRVWTSDLTDAAARQSIQRWTGQLVAPEFLGAHIGSPVNALTGRVIGLDFRAATALFGDLGVEWDLARADAAELDRLAAWIALYKRHRRLLHTGRTVRVDSPRERIWMHGVVSPDRSEAVFAYVQFAETVADPPPFIVPGLDPGRSYQAHHLDPGGAPGESWGPASTGRALGRIGLPPPARQPLSIKLVHLVAVDASAAQPV